jgi:hypothetical protein
MSSGNSTITDPATAAAAAAAAAAMQAALKSINLDATCATLAYESSVTAPNNRLGWVHSTLVSSSARRESTFVRCSPPSKLIMVNSPLYRLYGVTCLQTYYYFTQYQRDSFYLKLFVRVHSPS